jgi:glycosyltransferase involved in cell wall biosynthesis
MAVYNSEKFLQEAVASVLNQTYGDFELLVVNDGSTDNSEDIVLQYKKKDKRIRYLKNEKNVGQSESRNRAVVLARGEYVAIVDSDDICLPDRFLEQVAFMDDNPEIGILGTDYCVFYGESDSNCVMRKGNQSDGMDTGRVVVHNPTCMIRRELFERYGYYDPKFDNAEDVELFYRWFGRGARFANLDKCLYRYRIHGCNTSVARLRSQVYLLLKINVLAIFKYGIRFSWKGYLYMLEQSAYLVFLSFRLDRLFKR